MRATFHVLASAATVAAMLACGGKPGGQATAQSDTAMAGRALQ